MTSKLFLAILLSPFAALFAQDVRGTFSGTVTDQQGAAVPRAKITAMETQTGTKTSAVSEDSGAYTLLFLAPGKYDITAEAPGFKQSLRKGLTLDAGAHPVVDIHLEIGSVNEAVTVTAESPLITASNASIGQVITTREVEDLPVNGRTPLMLANLAMGAVSTFEPGPVRPFDNSAPTSVSLGRAPSGTNETLLDGAPDAGFGNSLAYSPPQDAVSEVRVNAFESNAAYGHTGGGTLNQITKSGTNSFHGSLYEFNQTSYLDANSFFTNAAGQPRPPYHYNQYGVSAGGPVWIPKVYNGKNRVFWFFAYEGLKDSDPANSPLETGNPVNFATVPTQAERNGDFSSEIALSLVLLIGAGLLLQSFRHLLEVRPGFEPHRLVTAKIWLPFPNDPAEDAYRVTEKRTAFYREVLRRVSGLAGVEQVAVGSAASLPMNSARNQTAFVIENRAAESERAPAAQVASEVRATSMS